LPGEGKLLILDGDLARTDSISFIAPPRTLTFGPDGASISVSVQLGPGEFAAVLVPRAGRFTAFSARFADSLENPRFSRDGRALYFLASGPHGGLSVLDLATLTEQRRIEVCANPLELGAMRDGRRAFLLCAIGEVAEIDLELGIVVKKQPLPSSCGARELFLSSNETALVLWCAAAGKVLLLDRVTLAPFDSIAAEPGEAILLPLQGGRPAGLIYADPPRWAAIDLGARTLTATVPLEDTVLTAAVAPGGRFLYLAGERHLWRLDTDQAAIDRSVKLPGRPAGIALWPAAFETKLRWFLR
jgi:hypothetical protein